VFYSTAQKWQATATPRLGAVFGDWMLYAKGGLAAGQANVSVAQLSGTMGAIAATQQRVGWTVGAGVEYLWNQHWVFGLEYDYLDFGTQNFAGWGVRTNGLNRYFSENVKLNYSEVLGRVSYKF
jgi:outer membrane immunogenic protein